MHEQIGEGVAHADTSSSVHVSPKGSVQKQKRHDLLPLTFHRGTGSFVHVEILKADTHTGSHMRGQALSGIAQLLGILACSCI